MDIKNVANQYTQSLLNKNRNEAENIVMSALENGVTIRDVYLKVFQYSQWEVGRLWQKNEISVAMEHYCTAATQLIMSRLYEYIFTSDKNGKVFVGVSVSGELHELGIRMVSDFFEMDGWSTHYLGANNPVDGIVEMLKETNADILAISATIYFNIPQVKEIIELVKTEPELSKTKVIVGGRVFNAYDQLWKEVKADGFAKNADGAIKQANELFPN